MAGTLHPDVQKLLDGPLQGRPSSTVAEIRATHAELTELLVGPGETVARTYEGCISTKAGAVPVRWYVPTAESPEWLIMYAHGGGFVSGTLDSYDTLCRALALRTGAAVVSFGYSLCPEVGFPVALEEVSELVGTAWSVAYADGLRCKKLALAGDSAGACLMSAAIHERALEEKMLPDAAILIYPMLDATRGHGSHETFATGYHLTSDRVHWFWKTYLCEDYETAGNPRDASVSPCYTNQLDLFPPTMIITAEFDPLRDEALFFAKRLTGAGIPVEHHDVPGAIHGFLRFRKVLPCPETGPDAVMSRIGAWLATLTD